MSKVLILAREDVVAALLGLMVELRGFEPRFLRAGDDVADTLERDRPRIVVIDCDFPDCGEILLEKIRRAGAKPILFSPFRMLAEVRDVATRLGVGSFTLPMDPETFGKMLLEM
ncbi:MAG: hypothetical protein ABR585_00325 [Gemmatimonadaceae bacterium]